MTLSQIAEKLDDLLNPISVKEMRQAVKGSFVTWLLIIFLLTQLSLIGFPLIFNEGDIGVNFSQGRLIFNFLLMILLLTCILFLPSYITIRLSMERAQKNVDLFFFTNLPPASIILGKTLAAMVLTLLYFSASVPFMTFTFLLRGLDLPSIFIVLVFNFMIVTIAIQLAIFTAALPGGVISRGIIGLVTILFLFLAFMGSIIQSHQMLESGIGSMIGSIEFWETAFAIITLIFCVSGLLFALSTVTITHPAANRSFGIRLYLVSVWIVTGVIAGIASSTHGMQIFEVWTISATIIFCIVMLVAICERQHHGPRIAREIPGKIIFRIPAFFLFSGAAGGIAFSTTIIALTIFFGAILSASHFHSNSTAVAANLGVFTFCSCLTALFIKKLFLPDTSRPYITAVIALGILMTVILIPAFMEVIENINPKYGIMISKRQLADSFMVLWNKKQQTERLVIFVIWAAGIIAVNMPWFAGKIRDFKPVVPR